MSNLSTKKESFFNSGTISKYHFRILLILSFLMAVIASISTIPGIIDHPQFGTNLNYDKVETVLRDYKILYAYRLFFIIDFIWSFLLLWIAWKLVKNFFQGSNFTRFGEFCFQIFSIIVILAWVFDTIENYFYLFHYVYKPIIVEVKLVLYALTFMTVLIVIAYQYLRGFLPSFINFLKSSIYSLLILTVIGVFLPKAPQVNSIIVNLYEHPLNFLIILLMAPTYAVVLAHYPSYFNISGKLRNWYRAEIRLGLFGTIFYKNRNKKPSDESLRYNTASYYNEKNTTQKPKKNVKPVVGYLNFLFRTLGILFYCALFYVIGYTSEINFDWKVSISQVSIVLFGIGTFLLYYLRKEKNEWLQINFEYLHTWLPDFYDEDYTPKQEEVTSTVEKEIQIKSIENKRNAADRDAELMKINKWINQYLIAFGLTVLAHIVLFTLLFFHKDIIGIESKYTFTTAILSLFCVGLQMITYVYYRTFRSVFRFTFFDEKNSAILNAFYILRVIEVVAPRKSVSKEQIEKNKQKIISFFEKHNFVKEHSIYKFFRAISFGALSNNISYLQVTIFFGIINALFILIINIFDSATLYFNPILIILSYFFFFYGIIVVLTKNFIYYRYSYEKFAEANKIKYYFLLGVSFLVLFGANRLGRAYSNDLFTLKLIESTSNDDVSLIQYVNNLPKDNTTRYYIGAYGGGMKANAWTLTVLNKLYEKDTTSTFFNKTIGISGASGGTMGLINMAAIIKSVENNSLWKHNIESISTSNILALDITHILGRDSFNHMLVPYFDLKGYDRSTKAMNTYANLSDNKDQVCKPTSYRGFWKKIYMKQGKQFPILIANSTNVLGNQGMAVSVKVEDSNLGSLLYHGANNILDISKNHYSEEEEKTSKKQELTLSYYDAASTSNRFPVISPAAKIETIGHFNDGGIYENSGLLSAYKLFRAINYCDGIDDYKDLKQTNVFISISNDKNQYIKYTIEKYVDSLGLKEISSNKINNSTEISAIIGSVASTEMMPIYIKNELQRIADENSLIDFETIYLPHRFTVADIKSIYGESLDFGKGIEAANKAMLKWVKENDSIIRNTLINKNGPIIEPPMSRMITKEAYKFMEKMLEHPTTENAINKIITHQ